MVDSCRQLSVAVWVAAICATTVCGTALASHGQHPLGVEILVQQGRHLLQAQGPTTSDFLGNDQNITESLLLLKAAIDMNGSLSSWTPSTSYCTWKGVQCNDAGQPTTLNLANEGLGGLLPWDNEVWSSLGSLNTINLAGNDVSGYIPPQIIQDLGLRSLNLANNSLAGPLPSALTSNMQSLSTRSNQLSGTIPSSWGNVSSLQNIDVSNNRLTGTLPSSWADLANARSLNFSANNLGGNIPANWRNDTNGNGTVEQGLVDLQYLGLGGNPLLCNASENAQGFILPTTYTLPCSPANVISISTAAATIPGLAPLGSPQEAPAPALSPEEVLAPNAALLRRPPAVEVPVTSPDAAPFLDIPGPEPSELPLAPFPSAPELSPEGIPAPEPALAPAFSPSSGPSPLLLPDLLPELAPSPVPAPEPAPAQAPAPEPAPVPAPAQAPAPVPAPAEAPTPELAPVPVPEPDLPPAPVPVPAPVVPVPAPAESKIAAPTPSEAPQASAPAGGGTVPVTERGTAVAPTPSAVVNQASVPSPPSPSPAASSGTGVNTNITVVGNNANLASFENLRDDYASILASATGRPVSSINIENVTAVSTSGNGSVSTTGRRLTSFVRNLLQTGNTNGLNINTFVGSDDPAFTRNTLNTAVQNGDLNRALNGIGLTLTGTPAITEQGAATPSLVLPTSGGHSAGYYLVRILPTVLGGLLAIALAALIAYCCWRRRKNRSSKAGSTSRASTRQPGSPIFGSSESGRATGRASSSRGSRGATGRGGGNTSLAEGLMFSHKPNPIFDTAETTSSRGDDYEVITLGQPGTRNSNGRDSNGSIRGMQGLQTGEFRWGAPGQSGSRETGIQEPATLVPGSSSQGVQTREFNSAEREFNSAQGIYETATGERDLSTEIYSTAQLRERQAHAYRSASGLSYESAEAPPAQGDIYRTNATNEAFESPNGTPRSRSERSGASFNSARSVDRSFRDASSFRTAPSQQTEFFDAESRGESFDYDAFLADIARRPLPEATASRRGLPPRPSNNPLYGQEYETEEAASTDHPILDNPIFASQTSTPRTADAISRRASAILDPPMTPPRESSEDDDGSQFLVARPATMVGESGIMGSDREVHEHPVVDSGGSFMQSGDMEQYALRSAPGSERNLDLSDRAVDSMPNYDEGQEVMYHPIDMSDEVMVQSSHSLQGFRGMPVMLTNGSIVDSAILPDNAVRGYPVTFSGGSIMESGAPGATYTNAQGEEVPYHPVTMSGGSIMQSGASSQGIRVSFSGGNVMDSGAMRSAPGSVRGHPVQMPGGSLMNSGASGAAYAASTHMGTGPLPPTAEGHPITFSDGSIMNSGATGGYSGSVGGHPVTFSGGSVMESGGMRSAPGSVREHPIQVSGRSVMASGATTRGYDSAEGHPVTFSGGSMLDSGAMRSAPGSAEGHPITFSDGSIMNSGATGGYGASVGGHPVTFSGGSVMESGGMRSAPGSVREHPIRVSGGSVMASGGTTRGFDSAEGHPVTFSGGSMLDSGAMRSAPGSAEGHPITFSDGSIMNSGATGGYGGSVGGHPVTFSGGSVMESGGMRSAPGSARGHPIQMSGGSVMASGATTAGYESAEGHPIQMTGGSVTASGATTAGYESAEGHPVTFSGGSMLDSGVMRSAPGSAEGHPVTFSDGSIMNSGATGAYGGSVGEHPVTFSGGSMMDSGVMRSAPGSARGHPIQMSGGSVMASGASSVDPAGRGHPVQLSDGSVVYSSYLAPESLQGHPLTESGYESMGEGSILGSAPESFRGHPVQMSDGSIVDSASLAGHPVTFSGGSVMASGMSSAPGGSVRGHAITDSGLTSTGGSLMASGGAMRSAPGSVRGDARRMDLSSTEPTETDPTTGSSGAHTPSSQTASQTASGGFTPYGLPPIEEGSQSGPNTGESFGGFETPPGSKTTRTVVRDTSTSHTSSVSHQTFDFAGQHMTPEQQGERFHFARTSTPKRGRDVGEPDSDEDDRYGIQEYDHPHMRGSMDSERGEGFLSSPLGSNTDLAGAEQRAMGGDMGSLQGHAITSSGLDSYQGGRVGSTLQAHHRIHPITGSTMSTFQGPESVQGHGITDSVLDSYRGPASLQGHPVTGSSMSSFQGPGSVQGHGIADSAMSSFQGPESVRAHPVTGSTMSSFQGPESVRGHGIVGSTMSSFQGPESVRGHPVTGSAMSSFQGPESVRGHPVTGSTMSSFQGLESVRGHPVTGSTMRSFGGPESVQGHGITMSGMSSFQGPESIRGHPVTASGGTSMMGSHQESIGGHPLTGSSMMGSNLDSMGGHPTHPSLLASDLPPLDRNDSTLTPQGQSIMNTDVMDTMQSAQGRRSYNGEGSIMDTGMSPQNSAQVSRSIWESARDGSHPSQTDGRNQSRDILNTDILTTARGRPTGAEGDSESEHGSMKSATSTEAHPVAYSGDIMGSDQPGSAQGHPIVYSGDSLMSSGGPRSMQGHPIVYSGDSLASSGQRSFRGHPVQMSDGSIVDSGSLAGHPITYSGGSIMASDVSGGDAFSRGGGQRGGSVAGHPITYSGGSLMASDVSGGDAFSRGGPQDDRLEGHPITYSGGSIMTSDASGAEGGFRRADPREVALHSAPHQPTIQEEQPAADALRHGTQNPMFASRHSNFSEESPEPGYTSRNPIFSSTGALTSEGGEESNDSQLQEPRASRGRERQGPNPLFDNDALMDTVDSLGGERNPLFDSTSGQQISETSGQRNALFGTDILDSMQGEQARSSSQGRTTSAGTQQNPMFDDQAQPVTGIQEVPPTAASGSAARSGKESGSSGGGLFGLFKKKD